MPTAMRPGKRAHADLTSWVADRDRAEDHAPHALVEPGLDRCHVADAATELHGDRDTRAI